MVNEAICTIYKNIYPDNPPHYVTIAHALERIRSGRSKKLIEKIRTALSKTEQDKLKRGLPAVCFSGKFGVNHTDESLTQHSGYIVLDFDELDDNLRDRQSEIITHSFIYACWVSPRDNGLKALVPIADGEKHREHFAALKDIFPDADRSGVNPSRICYESYDPDMYVNEQATMFVTTKTTERVEFKDVVGSDQEIFSNLLTWLANRNNAFVTGERNLFIFRLAAACCRFGLLQSSAESLISMQFPSSNDFTSKECLNAIRSAYRKNRPLQGSAKFERERFLDITTKQDVDIDTRDYEDEFNTRLRDVIYGADVKSNALDIYDHGYESVKSVGIPELDYLWKLKRGELTVLTGIGNYGKSTFKRYYQLCRAIVFDEKFGTFSPEDNPAHEFYHDLVEMLLGCDCTPANRQRPSKAIYDAAYDFISSHFFYVYPKTIAPTPEYIKEKFLELIVKENINCWDIDPFNQLTNDYNKAGGRSDKYLETFLSDAGRFSQDNNLPGIIVAHPAGSKMKKDQQGNYECPDVFDIADGGMWNNKADNIIVYHRPLAQSDPNNPMCQFFSKKIRRQKIVGIKGEVDFEMIRARRRFFFNGTDYLQKFLNERGLDFKMQQSTMIADYSKANINHMEDAPF